MGVSFQEPKYPVSSFPRPRAPSSLVETAVLTYHACLARNSLATSGYFLTNWGFQVIDPKPGFKRVVNNFSTQDYQKIGISIALSMPFGYFAGACRSVSSCSIPAKPSPRKHSPDSPAVTPLTTTNVHCQERRACRRSGCHPCGWLVSPEPWVAFAWPTRSHHPPTVSSC